MLLKRVESIYIHKLRLPLAAVDSHFKSEKQRERGDDAVPTKSLKLEASILLAEFH